MNNKYYLLAKPSSLAKFLSTAVLATSFIAMSMVTYATSPAKPIVLQLQVSPQSFQQQAVFATSTLGAKVDSRYLNIATMDYRPVFDDVLKQSKLNASIYSVQEVQKVLFNSLMFPANDKVKQDNQKLIQDYYQVFANYVPRANFSFAIADYNGYQAPNYDSNDKLIPEPAFTKPALQGAAVTFLFIDQNKKVTYTPVRNKNLYLGKNNSLYLKASKKIAINIVDFLGVTNPSYFSIVIANNEKTDLAIEQALSRYMDRLVEYYKLPTNDPVKATSVTNSKANNSGVSISSGSSGVEIKGGSIVANNIHISGGNVNVSNSNIKASNEVTIKSNELNVAKSVVSGKEVNVEAKVINDDGSLKNANINPKQIFNNASQFSYPTIAGMSDYFKSVVSLKQSNPTYTHAYIPYFVATGNKSWLFKTNPVDFNSTLDLAKYQQEMLTSLRFMSQEDYQWFISWQAASLKYQQEIYNSFYQRLVGKPIDPYRF